MSEKFNDRIAQGIRVVDAAIKSSARSYIPPDKLKPSGREILKLLATRYQRSDDEITRQLFEQLQQLKVTPTKGKIEAWVAYWENTQNIIIEKNMEGVFGFETIFFKEFLKAGRPWASNFASNWVQQKRAAEKSVRVFHIIRQFRLTVEEIITNKSMIEKGQAHTATLQGVPQGDQYQGTANPKNETNQNPKNNRGGRHSDNRLEEETYEGKQCLCGEVHLFRNCLVDLGSKAMQSYIKGALSARSNR